MKRQYFVFATWLTLATISVKAQVKIGTNPTSILPTANLQVAATNGSQLVVNKADGNLGIGTSTPLYTLDVVSPNRRAVALYHDATSFYGFGISSGILELYGNATAGANPQMVLTKDNVGIGTITPRLKLDVNGSIITSNNQGLWGTLADNTTAVPLINLVGNDMIVGATQLTGKIIFYTANGGTTQLASNGYMGLNTAPTERLHVNGNILATGTVTPSDVRYKENIASLTGALAKLSQVRGVSYTHKAKFVKERGLREGNQIGFIAQELEKVFPEFVVTSSDGYKAVDYARLTPVLVESLKEMNARLETQQAQTNAQQAEINELKAVVKQLIDKK